uniref:Uncharacterized protein n=1 Tax=Brassica oleracea var. oleracea TaxID=109376 RepID=A0A0D3BQV7_BRAOL
MDPAEERREMKRQKEYYNMVGYVCDSEYGIPRKCPCGSTIIDEVRGKEDYDTLPEKRMIGSIDCMHWEWKNCPTAWRGKYTRGSAKPTIVLEAVASHDLWIWHALFGLPGTLNDINVLDRSPGFDDILQGRAPRVKFKVNGHNYRIPYYLTDIIYPKWSTFIQSIPLPQGPKAELFVER